MKYTAITMLIVFKCNQMQKDSPSPPYGRTCAYYDLPNGPSQPTDQESLSCRGRYLIYRLFQSFSLSMSYKHPYAICLKPPGFFAGIFLIALSHKKILKCVCLSFFKTYTLQILQTSLNNILASWYKHQVFPRCLSSPKDSKSIHLFLPLGAGICLAENPIAGTEFPKDEWNPCPSKKITKKHGKAMFCYYRR